MKKEFVRMMRCALALWLLFTGRIYAQPARWDGEAADGQWSTPLNWEGDSLPGLGSDVLLNNSLMAGNYVVQLPAGSLAVHVKSLSILPTAGNRIEVILPPSNIAQPGFIADGPGYGLLIGPNGLFKNSSGISSGVSLQVKDSIQIMNNGHYIHNCQGSHAASIVQILSISPGSETGIFEFDIPAPSSTLSLSNRVFGKLVLSSTANAGAVTYTGTGINPVTIRSDFEIRSGVNFSLNISDTFFVKRNFIQSGGLFNLANGSRSLVLAISGNIWQDSGAAISESGTALPQVLLNGGTRQEVNVQGRLLNSIDFRLNNPAGAVLMHELRLPFHLYLQTGALQTTANQILILDSNCTLQADTVLATGWVNGPMEKLGLLDNDFLFPVGKDNIMRWIELHHATGSCTVEYVKTSPYSFSSDIGLGIDHLSKIECWRMQNETTSPVSAKPELSFDNVNSGGVTNLSTLLVAALFQDSGQWSNQGNTAVTGTAGSRGSVTGQAITIQPGTYVYLSLAGSTTSENPLPIEHVRLIARESRNGLQLQWSVNEPASLRRFVLEIGAANGQFNKLQEFPCSPWQKSYACLMDYPRESLFAIRLRIMGLDGKEFLSESIVVRHKPENLLLEKVLCSPGKNILSIQYSGFLSKEMAFVVVDMTGRMVQRSMAAGGPYGRNIILNLPVLSAGVYFVYGVDRNGMTNTLRFAIY